MQTVEVREEMMDVQTAVNSGQNHLILRAKKHRKHTKSWKVTLDLTL